MNAADPSRPMARRLRLLFGIYLVVLVALLLIGAEWILRSRGMLPWQPIYPTMSIEPGGKVSQPHPLLGYTAIPGSFVATDESGAHKRFTNLPNTLRITRPLSSYADTDAGFENKPEIWIFGCSFTYGSGLDDDETYPWQLQLLLPDHEVVNYGMGGYGTIQSLLQLREALKESSPKVAVLAFASLHDIRNTLVRVRAKQVVPYSRLGPFVQPFARLDGAGDLELHFAMAEYQEFPLMRRSAIVHALEQAYNELERRMTDSRAVSEALVLEMDRLSREHGTVFVVAGIWDAESMLEFAADNGIPTIDISLPQLPQYILSQRDRHPNAHAATIYAERLRMFLEPFLRVDSL